MLALSQWGLQTLDHNSFALAQPRKRWFKSSGVSSQWGQKLIGIMPLFVRLCLYLYMRLCFEEDEGIRVLLKILSIELVVHITPTDMVVMC